MNRKTAYALLGSLAVIFVATVGVAIGLAKSSTNTDTYDTAKGLASAFNCEQFEAHDEPDAGATSTGTCTLDGVEYEVSVYKSNEARDGAAELAEAFFEGEGGFEWLTGDKWSVSAWDYSGYGAVQDAIGGEVRTIGDPSGGSALDSDEPTEDVVEPTEDATVDGGDVAEEEAPDYSTLEVGQTREGLAVSSTVTAFDAAEPGPDAEQGVDYYVANVKQCVTGSSEPVLLSPMDFYVASPNGNTFDLGWDVQFGNEVQDFGPEYQQRDMSSGCNAGDILVKVPAGTRLSKMVLADPMGGDVAEWDVSDQQQ